MNRPQSRLPAGRLLPWVLLACLVVAAARTHADTGRPVAPLSSIEIPVRLSLDPLTRAADRMLPRQAGHWRSWKNRHGIESRYRAWRGPLAITVSGDVLLVQAHIRYWIRARKKVLGAIKLEGGCGVDEPPRQAVIGMLVRLGWGPDWSVRPGFRLLPTRFLDRCEMTFANIDVTPLVEKEFRKQMQESLRAALRTLAPDLRALREQAQQTWRRLQEPVAFGPDRWLLFRPAGVALSGITGRGDTIDAGLAIRLQPEFVTGAEPGIDPAPLPPLERHYPRTPGLNLHLGVHLDFDDLDQALADALAGKTIAVRGREAGIRGVTLAGSGREVRVRAEVSGGIAGTVEARARLAYDPGERKLVLQDLAYAYAAESPAVGLLEAAFHEAIRRSLEDSANRALVQYLDRLGVRLAAALENILPAGVSPDLSGLQFRSLDVRIEPHGIRLDGAATGNVRLVLR